MQQNTLMLVIQPSVIKALENQLNQPLFNPVGRHVVLNNAGQKYYRRIAPALEQIVEATETREYLSVAKLDQKRIYDVTKFTIYP